MQNIFLLMWCVAMSPAADSKDKTPGHFLSRFPCSTLATIAGTKAEIADLPNE